MKTEEQIKKQLGLVQFTLEGINKEVSPGRGAWRRTKGYIEALEWVLSCSEKATES